MTQQTSNSKISYLFLLIAFGYVTVLTPNLNAFDPNGPKFLTLSLLNLATYLFLFTRKELKTHPERYYAFFRNGIGLAYVGLMIVSLLSFFKAINVLESVLFFSKIFTVFSAAYLISILVMADKRNIRYLCIAMTLLLVYDSLTVFSGINKYIHGNLSSISDIKSVYYNKNGLTSAIFIKIPFALWLMVFNRKLLKSIGIIGTFLAIIAILFMSSRAFYLGIIALSVLLILYFSIQFLQSRDKYQLKLGGIYLILVLFAFLIFSTTQRYLYPKTEAKALSIEARLATITDPGGGNRLEGWNRSWHAFKENPLLGVGLGNWNIATLKEENRTNPDLLIQLKAHNDFIEITTETGILGGLFFITIFLLPGWVFIRSLVKDATPNWLIFAFLPTFGLFCYSVDAFFNFPRDRPEIQSLFALYVGIATIALFTIENKKSLFKRFKTNYSNPSLYNLFPILILSGLVIICSNIILFQNFKSLKLQYIAQNDIINGKFTHPASLFTEGFPPIPNINANSEPIAVVKARYLIFEKRNDEAIELLKMDKSNPYVVMPEIMIAQLYNIQNKTDSSMVYSLKAYNLKPYFLGNIIFLCNLLQKKGLQKEGEIIIDNYLDKIKTNKEAWLYAFSFYDKSVNIQKATSVIDSAAHYFPADSEVLKQKESIGGKTIIVNYRALYDTASSAFNAKKYNEAARYYSELLMKEPRFTEARISRAFCYYNIKEYAKSIQDLDFLISSGDIHASYYNVYNLRGVNYGYLGNKDEACKNYKMAADMGDRDGQNNYAKLCQTKN